MFIFNAYISFYEILDLFRKLDIKGIEISYISKKIEQDFLSTNFPLNTYFWVLFKVRTKEEDDCI